MRRGVLEGWKVSESRERGVRACWRVSESRESRERGVLEGWRAEGRAGVGGEDPLDTTAPGDLNLRSLGVSGEV